MEIRAPYDGIVKDLSVHTLGHVVQAGQPLLQVVPKGEVLRAEALLANEDVGFVAVGQTVKQKLAAYPFQKYGMLEGRVAQISADAIEQAEAARAAGTNALAAPVQTPVCRRLAGCARERVMSPKHDRRVESYTARPFTSRPRPAPVGESEGRRGALMTCRVAADG
jgi:hypothetical protein